MNTCTAELHEMYPGNCPECNPEGYQKLLAKAPQGREVKPEPPQRPTRRTGRVAAHDQGYSDTY
jgi:hypothetical protein